MKKWMIRLGYALLAVFVGWVLCLAAGMMAMTTWCLVDVFRGGTGLPWI